MAASLAAILVVAFCVRVAYAWSYEQQRPRLALAILPFEYEPGNIAASLAEGKGFSSPFREPTGPTAWLTPVYPFLLAGIFRVFGVRTLAAFQAAAGLNIVFSTLTAVPIYFIGRRLGGTRVAALAAWLWTIFPNAIKLPVESIWDTSLAALLAALLLWATIVLGEQRDPWRYYACGLLWGLALMTNSALGALLPFFLAWLVWRSRQFTGALMAIAAAALCCLPWTIRNFTVFHAFIPARSVVGLTLWLGNHDQSSPVWIGRLHPLDNLAERARYVDLGEIDYMREKQQQAIAFAVEHPAEEVHAAWSHFVAFWSGGSTHPLADLIHVRSWSFRFILLFNLLAAIGGLAGIVALWRAHSIYAPLLAVYPLIFPLVYYVTLGSARYSLPMDPVLLLLASAALNKKSALLRLAPD